MTLDQAKILAQLAADDRYLVTRGKVRVTIVVGVSCLPMLVTPITKPLVDCSKSEFTIWENVTSKIAF